MSEDYRKMCYAKFLAKNGNMNDIEFILKKYMFKKFAAVIQLTLMFVVVATSQPSLSYCLCADEFYLGDCVCHVNVTDADASSKGCSEGCCSHSTKEASDSNEPTKLALHTQPCTNCLVDLSLSVDDFILASVESAKKNDTTLLTHGIIHSVNSLATKSTFSASIHAIRGSPPSIRNGHSVPLFVRHSAFLL